MEEKEGKVVNLNAQNEQETVKKKLSYEELENVAKQLSEQNRQMYMKLQEMNTVNLFKRLDYLFKVLSNCIHFEDSFVSKCAKEIEEIITIPEEKEEKKEE
jgi:hypothetical protein